MTESPNRQDILNCYHLALGREPESETVIQDKLGQPKSGLLRDFFSSSEFNEAVRSHIAGASPPQTSFRSPPSLGIREWAADYAPLSPEGAEAVRAAESWAGLYRALFADEIFSAQVLDEAAQAANRSFIPALAVREQTEAASRIDGRVELITPHEVRGWALDRGNPQRRLCLELWIEGVFRAATTTDRYRPELQEQFGGSGMFGFILSRPLEPDGAGPVRAELREARSSLVVDVLQLLPVSAPLMDTTAALRRELADVQALLKRIEQRLPDLNEAYSFGLDLYSDYFETYYTPVHATTHGAAPPLDLVAIVDATSASPAELASALASLALQAKPPRDVAVVYGDGDLMLEFQYALASWRGRFPDPRSPHGVLVEDGWASAMQVAMSKSDAPQLFVVDARARLAPDASEGVHGALSTGAAMVYADSDVVEVLADGKAGRHRDPTFRTAFDSELFLQQGDIGPLVGFSRQFLEEVGWGTEADTAGLFGLVLRGLAHPGVGSFVHIPRVLSHATGASPLVEPIARAVALEGYLAARRPGAHASPHADLLGGPLPSTFRVRQTLPAGSRAAVIITTRDRGDLLDPCLASLTSTAEHNRARLEILVVDNQSREPETFALLDRLSRTWPLRVIPYDGAFNWALMNNLAAAETDAEVLIFLNNDTAALTPDWCDELCSQALRQEVGAVGARLLYADGTIQHAGVVTGGWHAFAAHEGVGAPGRDPGYRGRHALLREVSAVTGACLATRRSAFETVGGFDALNLPVEANDIDYCFRIRAAGLKVLYDPYCTFYHYESKSRGLNMGPSKRKLAEAASRLMRARWGEAYGDDPFYNAHFDRLAPPLTRLRPPVRAGQPSGLHNIG